MKITIDLPQDLEQDLIRESKQLNISLETLILQSLRQLSQGISSTATGWSDLIQNYEGVSDFPVFESYTYAELLGQNQPKVITSDAENKEAIALVEELSHEPVARRKCFGRIIDSAD